MTGNKYFRRGDYVSALNWYKSSQAITYTNEVANNIALIHMHNNEFEKADKILLKALKNQDKLEIRLNRIRMMVALSKYEEALIFLDETRKLYDCAIIWYYYGGVLYEGLEKFEEALTAYMHSYDTEKSVDVYIAIVKLEIHLGYYDLAIRHIEHEVMPVKMKNEMMAMYYKARHEWTEYEIHMEKAIEISDESTTLLIDLSKYYLNKSQLIKAIECIALIDQEDQDLESVVLAKAIIAEAAGNSSDYRKHVDQLLRVWKSEVRLSTIG